MDVFTDILWAYVCGGAICVFAQILLDKTKLSPARILVLLVVCGVFLGAVGVYGAFADFAGAGATTPLTGFGYLIANGVRKAVDESGFSGVLRGSLSAAAGGTAVALCLGFVSAVIFKNKPRR